MIEQIPVLSPAASGGSDADASVSRAVAAIIQRLHAAKAVTFVLNDPQRATCSAAILGRMREPLAAKPIRALIATGTHHFRRQCQRRFEREALSDLKFDSIAWHDCDSAQLVAVGGERSWRCHPWLLDQDWAVLAIGSCEPHYFAGITGAHKTLTVGCAAAADVQSNHFHALSAGARPGGLAGNPVHQGIAAMLGALSARRQLLAINLLQPGGRILLATCGEPLEALAEIAARAQATYMRPIEAPADALVLEVAGVLARSFYQADKAIKNNEWAVRDGGSLVLVAACPEGIGQHHFMRLLKDCPTYESARAAVLRRGYRLGDHKAVKLRYLTDRRRVRVYAVSPGLTNQELSVLGFVRAGSAEQALSAAGIDPSADRVYRVADAANTCAVAGS